MKFFDNYEIHGVHEFGDDGLKFCEQVPDDQAMFWTLYGHIHGEGAVAIGDFATRQHAEETFERITGIPFNRSYTAGERLRVMHAGPRLLQSVIDILALIDNCDMRELMDSGEGDESTFSAAHALIAEVTGRAT